MSNVTRRNFVKNTSIAAGTLAAVQANANGAPNERINVADHHPELSERYRTLLQPRLDVFVAGKSGEAAELSPETIERTFEVQAEGVDRRGDGLTPVGAQKRSDLRNRGLVVAGQRRPHPDPLPGITCGCPACRNYSRAYLHHVYRTGEIISSMLMVVRNDLSNRVTA